MTQPRDVRQASELYQDWLSDLKARAGLVTHNQSQAMMKAVMHVLRRYLTVAQVLTFTDALPPLPRGIFIEGWRPAETVPALSSAEAFTEEVFRRLSPHHVPPDSIVADVFAVWARFSSPGENDAMRGVLPPVLRPLWPQPG